MCVIETFAEQVFIDDAGNKSVRQSYRTRRGKIRYRYIALVSCGFCGDDFVPTRRGVHKYCSTSCRSRACKARKPESKSYEKQSQSVLQPVIEAEVLSPAPAAKPLAWDWTRTAENVVASGTVAFAQYYALEDMIVKQFNQLRAEIRQSEARNTQRLQQLAATQMKKKAAAPQPKGIDAMDFEKVARSMLE